MNKDTSFTVASPKHISYHVMTLAENTFRKGIIEMILSYRNILSVFRDSHLALQAAAESDKSLQPLLTYLLTQLTSEQISSEKEFAQYYSVLSRYAMRLMKSLDFLP